MWFKFNCMPIISNLKNDKIKDRHWIILNENIAN